MAATICQSKVSCTIPQRSPPYGIQPDHGERKLHDQKDTPTFCVEARIAAMRRIELFVASQKLIGSQLSYTFLSSGPGKTPP